MVGACLGRSAMNMGASAGASALRLGRNAVNVAVEMRELTAVPMAMQSEPEL